MALTPKIMFPNLVLNGYGNLNSGYSAISPAQASRIGESARALCVLLSPDTIQSLNLKTLKITASLTWKIYSGSDSISRCFGKILVVRNFLGDVTKFLFDPLLTENTPNISDAGVVTGNAWQINGVTLPRFDWEAANILHAHFLALAETVQVEVPVNQIQQNESLLVVMTPIYGNATSTPAPNDNSDPTLGYAGVGQFIGAGGSSNNAGTIAYRSLSVYGSESC